MHRNHFPFFKAMISWPDLPRGEAATLWWKRCENRPRSPLGNRKAGTGQVNLHTERLPVPRRTGRPACSIGIKMQNMLIASHYP